MAIEMSSGIYCPLSPRDPLHRLDALVQQTQCQLVLVHWPTRTKVNDNSILLYLDSVLTDTDVECELDVDRLSSILVTSNDISYTIFTSGSTGTPKAVRSHAHQ